MFIKNFHFFIFFLLFNFCNSAYSLPTYINPDTWAEKPPALASLRIVHKWSGLVRWTTSAAGQQVSRNPPSYRADSLSQQSIRRRRNWATKSSRWARSSKSVRAMLHPAKVQIESRSVQVLCPAVQQEWWANVEWDYWQRSGIPHRRLQSPCREPARWRVLWDGPAIRSAWRINFACFRGAPAFVRRLIFRLLFLFLGLIDFNTDAKVCTLALLFLRDFFLLGFVTNNAPFIGIGFFKTIAIEASMN